MNLDEAPCGHRKQGNCGQRPNCLHNLGLMNALGIWAKSPRSLQALGADPETLVRRVGQRVGLKNPHSTCFLNSNMQAMFALPAFRSLVYDSIAWYENAAARSGGHDGAAFIDATSVAVLREVRRVFSHLESSTCAVFDPSALISLMDVDIYVPEDVNVFGARFLGTIREALKHLETSVAAVDKPLSDCFARMFDGSVATQTECDTCGCKGTKTDSFLELQPAIEGLGHLVQILDSHFLPQKLSGTNQYVCPNCRVKRVRLVYCCSFHLTTAIIITLGRSHFLFTASMHRMPRDRSY
jgi:hypothetical protein